MKLPCLSLFIAAVLASPSPMAATRNGDLDLRFGDLGYVYTRPVPNAYAHAYALDFDNQNRTVLAGETYGGNSMAVARFLSNGDLDSSFADQGHFVLAQGTASKALVIHQLANGELLIGGYLCLPGCDMAVVKLTAAGNLVASFGSNGIFRIPLSPVFSVNNILPMEGGARYLLVGGDAAVVMNASGDVDSSFGSSGAVRITGTSVQSDSVAFQFGHSLIDSQNRLLLIGMESHRVPPFDSVNSDFAVVRLMPNGDVDTSFGQYGLARIAFDIGNSFDNDHEDRANDAELAADGSIWVVGYARVSGTNSWSAYNDFAVAKLDSAGQLESAFSEDGKLTLNFSTDFIGHCEMHSELGADGVLLLTGPATDNAGMAAATTTGLARVFADGSLDPAFGNYGRPRPYEGAKPWAMMVKDGYLYTAGSGLDLPYPAAQPQFFMARRIIDVLHSDGFD